MLFAAAFFFRRFLYYKQQQQQYNYYVVNKTTKKQAKTKNVNISRDQSALEYSSIWADEKLRPSSTNKQFYFRIVHSYHKLG